MHKPSLRLFLLLLTAQLVCACGQLDLGSTGEKGKSGHEEITGDEYISVSEAQGRTEGEEVTVIGYYVGFVNGTTISSATKGRSYDKANTNLLLCEDSLCLFPEECLPVELPKGEVRDALNSFDNPELFGRRLLIRGTLAAYCKTLGLKSPTAWKLAEGLPPAVTPADTTENEEGTDPIEPVPVVNTFPKILPSATPVSRGR